jgi:serine/threonine-protein kinase
LWELANAGNLKESMQSFRQAIAADASYALAYCGLADAFIAAAMHGMMPPQEAFPKARGAMARALAVDCNLAEAACSGAWIQMCFDRDWAGARASFGEALRRKPGYPFAWSGLAVWQLAHGCMEEALATIKTAWMHDALSPSLNGLLGQCYYYARRFPEAISLAQSAATLTEDFSPIRLASGLSYLQLGDYDGSIHELEIAYEVSCQSPSLLGYIGCAYGLAGDRDKGRAILQELIEARRAQHVPAFPMALTCLGLNDIEQTFAFLREAVQERSHLVLFLQAEPLLDELRQDSRFGPLLQEIGITPGYAAAGSSG